MAHRVEHDPERGILQITFSDEVTATEVRRCREELHDLLPALKPGFQVLTDFTDLKEMDPASADDVREMMHAFNERGVARVIRVMPDPHKDIGFTILSHFHYGKDTNVQTYETRREAHDALAI